MQGREGGCCNIGTMYWASRVSPPSHTAGTIFDNNYYIHIIVAIYQISFFVYIFDILSFCTCVL